MRKIRWGILGCGKIARKFASDLKWVEHSVCFAVASTDPNRALDFAKTYGFEQAFDSYQKLVESDVDVIYIATPHGFHYEHVMLCLNHKKAVLCEKAFALNSKQLQEMVSTARTNKIFLMEAFWTRFLPQYLKTSELLQGHAIGSIAMISADFGFKASEPPAPRLYEPRLGGGALLDIGIYPVFLAVSLLGRPSQVTAVMDPFESGVDRQISIALQFSSGALASLNASLVSDTPVEAVINGTSGRIRLTNRFHNPSARLYLSSGVAIEKEIEVYREHGNGYQFEARHVQECLQVGATESPMWSLDSSLLLMETLDRIRMACGISYPHLES